MAIRTALLSLFISLAHIAMADNNAKGTILGYVLDEQKQPVAAATVRIEGTQAGCRTADDGRFSITDAPAGSRTLVVECIGYKTLRRSVDIASGRTLDLGTVVIGETRRSLGEVTVIGKSEARRLQQQAYAISVLDVKRNYSSDVPLGKMLNKIGSVRMREDGGLGSSYSFSLNGFSGNQVRFFLDGIPMDNFGSSFNLSNISVNMAERVEVYKGVLPVSLGGDALGGAVNIVSRKDANYLDASYSYGSFNTHKASVNGAYTAKNGFTVRLNAFFNYSDNDYKVFAPILDLATNEVKGNRWVRRFHDGYRSMGLKAEAGVVGKKYADYLLAGVIVSSDKSDVQTGATMDKVLGGTTTRGRSIIPTIRYKKDGLFTDGLSLSLYGTYAIVDSWTTDTLARTYNWEGQWVASNSKGEGYYTDTHIYDREWQGNGTLNYIIDPHQSLTLNHTVTALSRHADDAVHRDQPMNNKMQHLTKNITGLGWQIRYDRWNATVFGKMYRMYSSAYKLLDQFTDKERWELLSGNKTDFGYGAAATWFVVPSLQVKASYEHAFRLPEAVELFGDGLLQQRNPDLKPESSHNVNLGIGLNRFFGPLHHLTADLGLIYRNSKDFIRRGVSATANPTTSYKNQGKVETKGIELTAGYEFNRLFHVGAGFTYQDIKDRQRTIKSDDSYVGSETENPTYNQRIPNIPYFFANATAGVSLDDIFMKGSKLTVDYNLNYVHEYYLAFPGLGEKNSKSIIPMQMSHDVAVGYSLAGGRYSITAECTNITNEKLYDNFRLQKPGRAFSVKLRYFINKR